MWEDQKQRRSEGGFTLIELLIVIIILAILAAIVVFAVGTTGTNATVASCKADAKSVEVAIEAYKASHTPSAYPAANAWTSLLGTDASGGPWLKAQPGTTHYNIGWDTSGHVIVGAGGTGGVPAYTAGTTGNNIDENQNACSVAS
jgi:prepilin-type N-terminal cleavage/methylation domain-containing protein